MRGTLSGNVKKRVIRKGRILLLYIQQHNKNFNATIKHITVTITVKDTVIILSSSAASLQNY